MAFIGADTYTPSFGEVSTEFQEEIKRNHATILPKGTKVRLRIGVRENMERGYRDTWIDHGDITLAEDTAATYRGERLDLIEISFTDFRPVSPEHFAQEKRRRELVSQYLRTRGSIPQELNTVHEKLSQLDKQFLTQFLAENGLEGKAQQWGLETTSQICLEVHWKELAKHR